MLLIAIYFVDLCELLTNAKVDVIYVRVIKTYVYDLNADILRMRCVNLSFYLMIIQKAADSVTVQAVK